MGADLVARFTIPAASDQFPGFRWLFYSTGLVGAGGTIFAIVASSEHHWGYATLYAHSLFYSGFAALGGTPLIVKLGGQDGYGNNGRILQICGCLLILAAIPVLFLKIARLTEPKD